MASVLHRSDRRRPTDGEAPSRRRHRRRWPWIIGAVGVLILGAAVVMWARHDPARPVTVGQAQNRFHSGTLNGPTDRRPDPGVYLYKGSGTDRLSLPSLSQAQGPTMPVTVTLTGPDCWKLRIDYSTHHWQSWDYCLAGGRLVETGGQFWQLWQVGPLNITNHTTITCSPAMLVVPAELTAGQTWRYGCTSTSSAVKGQMTSTGTTQYLGDTTMQVGGQSVVAHHFVQTQTDAGAQRGTERYETWLARDTGLPLRLQHEIHVTTSTMFGNSTYTQSGNLTAEALRPQR